MIAARDVCVRVGAKALLDHVCLDVEPGELLALVGPNGAGKSTLLSVLAGDRHPDGGWVELNGARVDRLDSRELARRRAVLPQSFGLRAALSAREVVELGRASGGRTRAESRASTLLEELELGDAAGRPYPSLSGGERQRVQLARVLEQLGRDGGALLLDEPTSALDPRHQHLVMALARAEARRGCAVVAVLHDLTLAARWADRVVLLCAGRVVCCDEPERALTRERLEAVYGVDFELVRGASGLLVAARS